MHCQWRLFRPFIMKCAKVLGNDQIKEDPGVSDFNVHRFFLLNIVTPAAGEYLLELAQTPGGEDLDDASMIMAKAEANVNFDWLCHFLHDCAFFVLDFRPRAKCVSTSWSCSSMSLPRLRWKTVPAETAA